MWQLFERINGSPMEFHLANLPEEYFEKYSNLIRSNGGKVKTEPHEKVLTFTLPSRCHVYLFVFDVKFIEDCVQSKKILNVDNYFIGDSRLTPKCEMSKLALGTNACLCCFLTRKDLEDASVKRLEKLSLEEAQGSGLKSKPLPLQKEKLTSKENDLVSIHQQIPAIVVTEVTEPNSRFSESRISTGNSEMSSSNAGTTVLVSDSSDSENISEPRSRSESFNSSFAPEPIIDTTKVNESKTNISKSQKSPTNSERSSANPVTLVSDTADYEISKSPILSSEKSTVKAESSSAKSKKEGSICEPVSKSLSKSESVNLKSLPEAFVVLRKLDESQLRKSEVVLKSEPLVAEESSASEFEVSDMEDESSDTTLKMEESDSEPSTSKCVPKRRLGKRHPPESFEPTEELIQWAKKITQKIKKDEYGYPKEDGIFYQPWEKQLMVDFLIKTKKIDASGGPNVWQLACNLKIFPKFRSYSALRGEFRTNVLPYIESYNLPPKIEAQFIKSRPKVEEASEELKAWAKEVTKTKNKDNLGYPEEGRKIFEWEQKMILDFLIESKRINRARFIETWELAYSLKILPQRRSKSILQAYFLRNILPRIENFNLPQNIEAQFLKLRKPGVEGLKGLSAELKAWAQEFMKDRKAEICRYKKPTHRQLETWDLDAMVQYLIRANIIDKARMTSTWELASKLNIFSKRRTCDYLVRAFRKLILPKIEDFNLPPDIEAKFVKLRQKPKNSRKVEISEEVKAWAVQVMRNRTKDAFGFPVELRKFVQPWEKRVMLDFVVKMERIDLAKAPNFWALAYELKIVPKQRTKFTLANTFCYHILPKIESYGLSPEIQAEFIKSRTVADIKRVPRKTPMGLDISIS